MRYTHETSKKISFFSSAIRVHVCVLIQSAGCLTNLSLFLMTSYSSAHAHAIDILFTLSASSRRNGVHQIRTVASNDIISCLSFCLGSSWLRHPQKSTFFRGPLTFDGEWMAVHHNCGANARGSMADSSTTPFRRLSQKRTARFDEK